MSCSVRFAPEAPDQLDTIEAYITLASGFPQTAERFVDGIVTYCQSFETFPERGARRDDLLPGLRIIGYRKNVTVAFRVDTDRRVVSIVGVFYGGQDYETAMAINHQDKAEH